MRVSLLNLALASSLLAGCATTLSNPPVAQIMKPVTGGITVKTPCPHPVKYTDNEQETAADELAALPPNSVVGQMIQDYGALRDQATACAGTG